MTQNKKKICSIIFSLLLVLSSIPARSADNMFVAPPLAIIDSTVFLSSQERTVNKIIENLKSRDPQVRAAAIQTILLLNNHKIKNKLLAYIYSLPVSGKAIFDQAKRIGKPVIACNVDNGELSALQIRAFMEKAIEKDAFAMFEVGPGALLTYADGKPHLPQYCAQVAQEIYEETGRLVAYAVHLDHNQVDAKLFATDPTRAVQEAIDRALFALEMGFTSFATDTSTLPKLKDVIWTAAEIITAIEKRAMELGVVVGHEGEIDHIGGTKLSTVWTARRYVKGVNRILNKTLKPITGIDYLKDSIFDVLAGNFGTKHGYTFDENDQRVPYKSGVITVKQHQRNPKLEGYVLDLATAIFLALGKKLAIALHGFSGTTAKVAKMFIGKGIAKVNINTDWQGIYWEKIKKYYPKLYREIFNKGRIVAARKRSPLVTNNPAKDFKNAENRIIFGKSTDKAPGARTFFRRPKRSTDPRPEGWIFLEKITKKLKNGRKKIGGLTALEAINSTTKNRYGELLEALELQGSAKAIHEQHTFDARKSQLRLQNWQMEEIRNMLLNIEDQQDSVNIEELEALSGTRAIRTKTPLVISSNINDLFSSN